MMFYTYKLLFFTVIFSFSSHALSNEQSVVMSIDSSNVAEFSIVQGECSTEEYYDNESDYYYYTAKISNRFPIELKSGDFYTLGATTPNEAVFGGIRDYERACPSAKSRMIKFTKDLVNALEAARADRTDFIEKGDQFYCVKPYILIRIDVASGRVNHWEVKQQIVACP